ncbi:MAG: glycosyltransferase family 4 protein [Candidatus Omnitrophica bacterium]|nr:glycosyltransferase family 4 protein [Candidatus Omnitrophota bacterium]
MNVLLINKYHYYRAGPETVYLKSAELLRKHGHNVLFFSMHHPENLSCSTEEYFVPYVELTDQHSILNQFRIAWRILYSLKARRNLSKLLDRYPVDIAHLHDICYHISPSILHELKKRAIPVVMTLHDFKMVCTSYYMFAEGKICEACRQGSYYMAIKKRCVKDSLAKSAIAFLEMYLHHGILGIYDSVDVFITPSLFLKEKLEGAGFNKNIVQLYNFLDINEQDDIAGESCSDNMKNAISYIGRLSQEKGLITLLDAAKSLLDRGSKVRINIIGDGPLMEKLQEKVKAEQINNVNFAGYLKRKDVYREIRNSLAVVLPSEWYENNPMSVIEAFALGRPVIGSRIGGIPELVRDHERGLLFQPGDANELSSVIEYFMDHPGMAGEMGKKAREFYEEELNQERHYQRLMVIYKQISESSKLERGTT